MRCVLEHPLGLLLQLLLPQDESFDHQENDVPRAHLPHHFLSSDVRFFILVCFSSTIKVESNLWSRKNQSNLLKYVFHPSYCSNKFQNRLLGVLLLDVLVVLRELCHTHRLFHFRCVLRHGASGRLGHIG